jgi:hypothetical protein
MELGKILNLCLVILGLGIISRYLIGEKLKRGEKPLGSFKMSLFVFEGAFLSPKSPFAIRP